MSLYPGATPPSLPTLVSQIFATLSSPPLTDPILTCPLSTLAILPARPASLIRLAHDKIHSFSFDEVPLCWRRLYTDASLYNAIAIVEREIRRMRIGSNSEWQGMGKRERKEDSDQCDRRESRLCASEIDDRHEPRKEEDNDDWIQKVVKLLDMAVIMTGAPEREEMIETLLLTLQDYVQEDLELHERPPRKKPRRLGGSDVFSTSIENAPDVQHPVPKSQKLSMTAFEKHLQTARPLVIQGALSHWLAFEVRPWKSPQHLRRKTFGGRRLVPVEVGRSYTDEGWGQKIVTFGEFMDRYLIKDNTNREEKESSIGYLAQHDLFAQIPSLRSDIAIPDYCYTEPPPPAPGTPLASKAPQSKLNEPLLNAWFGPAGTVSPLHTDPYHNVLCQVVGKKYVRLYSPQETEKLYPRGVEAGGVDMSNTSQVDAEGDAQERDAMFPAFKEAQYIETILSEGECLYVPVGWWHYVRSLTVSFSVSFWWN